MRFFQAPLLLPSPPLQLVDLRTTSKTFDLFAFQEASLTKSVDQQKGKRLLLATYHASPPHLSLTLALICGDYTGKTPTNLHARSHEHTHTQIIEKIQKYRVFFLTGTLQFHYKKENCQAANQVLSQNMIY